MDEIDSAATWAFIHKQQEKWRGSRDDKASPSSSIPGFPGPLTESGISGISSPDDLSVMSLSDSRSLTDSGFSSLSSSMYSSRSGTLSSASTSSKNLSPAAANAAGSGTMFLPVNRDFNSTGTSVTSQDSGFDETDSVPLSLSGPLNTTRSKNFLDPSDFDLPTFRIQTDQEYDSSALTRCHDSGVTQGGSHFDDYSGEFMYAKGGYSYCKYSVEEDNCVKCPPVLVRPAELSLLLKTGLDKYLLIDCRSFLEFNTNHIHQSVNISGTKIVKRRLQHNRIHIRELLLQTCHIDTEEYQDVIVYDQCTENPNRLTDDNFLAVLLDKLTGAFKSVALLKGGFLAFQAMYPSLCVESKTASYRCAALTSLSQPCLPVSNVGPTRILPFLYLGSQQDALSPDIAQVNEITYILNVSTNGLRPAYISDGHFLRIPVNDNYSAKLTPYFEQAFQFLDKVREANGCCLVHCLAGISRSPTLAIAYIMKHLNLSSDDAYRYVKDKRPTISPNFNFLGQLLEFEKQLKHDKELNNNDGVDGCQGNKSDPWTLPAPSFSPALTATRKGFSKSSECIQSSQGSSQGCVVERKLTIHQGTTQQYENDENLNLSLLSTLAPPALHADSVTKVKSELSVKKSSFSLTCKSLRIQTKETHKFPSDSKERVTGRPCVLNLGVEPQSRRVPFKKDRDLSMVPSKSLTDITESSETPSPITNSKSQENIYSTSFKLHKTKSEEPPQLLSPFPCGETTIRTSTVLNNYDHVPYSGNSKNQQTMFAECSSSVVKTEKSKQLVITQSESSNSSSKTRKSSSLHESKGASASTEQHGFTRPFSLSDPVIRPGDKRPLRSTLSLALSPVTPHAKPLKMDKTPTTTFTGLGAPSACKIERKLNTSSHFSCHVDKQDSPCTVSGIPKHHMNTVPSSLITNPVTTSTGVKLKSFSLSASLPLSLMAQSPTTSLAKLHFGSNENSDNSDNECMKMDMSESNEPVAMEAEHQECPLKEKYKLSYRKFHDSLEKLSSFPSTSLDKLNFTPCLSSSNENLLSSNTSPRTSGVKRPLNMDVNDLKDSDLNMGASNPGSPSSGESLMSSPTGASQQKVVVRKREGRANKRTMVRPNSIAFSSYPTFDLGSDCQDSPHSSSGSSASQDDSSEMYTQSGKKSKPSEYMSDVRFRLGRYSEREVYRQITAAMEAAMMKSQSFEASRKSRSLDDILSSEDDNSAPNCEWSHFDRVLRRCGINRDKFSSPPLRLEKLACGSELGDLCHSSSSISSTSSHTSLHSSMELIGVS